MRLVPGNTDHHDVYVQCLACGRMVSIRAALIDLDGPPFKAYYHARCVPGAPLEVE